MNQPAYKRLDGEQPDDAKYELTSALVVTTGIKPPCGIPVRHGEVALYSQGTMVVETGFRCDGPSSVALDDEYTMGPCIVHDGAYSLLRGGCFGRPDSARWKQYRQLFDALLCRHMQEVAREKWAARFRDDAKLPWYKRWARKIVFAPRRLFHCQIRPRYYYLATHLFAAGAAKP
jgi:hypothetical protein